MKTSKPEFFIVQLFLIITILSGANVWGAAHEDVAELHTITEVQQYSQQLSAFIKQNAHDPRVLNAEARKSVKLLPGIVLTSPVWEAYNFSRTYALSFSELKIGEETSGPESDIRYDNAIRSVKEYFTAFAKPNSALNKQSLLFHRALLQKILGAAYNGKIKLLSYNWQNHLTEIRTLMPEPITALHDGLKAIEELRSFKEWFQQAGPLIPLIKLSLVEAYCIEGCFCAEQKQSPFAPARVVRQELRKLDAEAYREAGRLIEFAEKNHITFKTSVAGAKTPQGALRNARLKSSAVAAQAVAEAAQEMSTDLQYKVIAKHRNIHDPQLTPQNIIDSMRDIENTIARDNLMQTYEYYQQVFGKDMTVADLKNYTLVLLETAHLDEALPRAEILVSLSQNNPENYLIARLLYAVTKNLQGEPEAWLSLEEEFKNTAQAVAEHKNEAQKLGRKKIAQHIKRQKEAAARQQREKEGSQQVRAACQQIDNSPAMAQESSLSTSSMSTVDTQVEKAERLQRHAEAVEARKVQQAADEDERKSEVSFHVALKQADSGISARALELERLLASSDLKLQDYYYLTGLPLDVDVSIEGKSWQFTRGELQAYFEAMGCTIHERPHTKIGLPKALHVKKGDEVITILNEFGGALTLPAWEQRNVPPYLRRQISAARDRLRALAIKASASTVSEGDAAEDLD